jgi:hypothetical protein
MNTISVELIDLGAFDNNFIEKIVIGNNVKCSLMAHGNIPAADPYSPFPIPHSPIMLY